MTEHETIIASHAIGEPVAPLPAGAEAELARIRDLCLLLRQSSPSPAAGRREAVIARVKPAARFGWNGWAAAAMVVLAAGIFAVGYFSQQPPVAPAGSTTAKTSNEPLSPPSNEPGAPDVRPPARDWVKEQSDQVFAKPAEEGSGAGFPPPPGRLSGGSAPLDPQGLLPTVLGQVDFRALYWPEGPGGMQLESAKVVRAAKSGLEFDVVRLEYRHRDLRLVVIQASDSDAAVARLMEPEHDNGAAVAIRRDGVVLLALCNSSDRAALQAMLKGLRPVPR
ncbi:MAG: hypothetical protein KF754_02930 [Planctomycetes bacterium]|nr:hypothetical protein [Planctomycetota bacterium]